MALSKNFTLPEKCKNHWRALRESLILIRQFLYSKLFGSSLIFLRETGAGAASGHALSLFSLFFFSSPGSAPEARRCANSCGELSSLL